MNIRLHKDVCVKIVCDECRQSYTTTLADYVGTAYTLRSDGWHIDMMSRPGKEMHIACAYCVGKAIRSAARYKRNARADEMK